MVCQQQCHVPIQEWLSGIAQGRGARGRVGDTGYLTQQQRNLREYVTGEPLADHRETGSRGRMGMDHRTTLLPPSVYPQVQI
jgi:hypothetical protein